MKLSLSGDSSSSAMEAVAAGSGLTLPGGVRHWTSVVQGAKAEPSKARLPTPLPRANGPRIVNLPVNQDVNQLAFALSPPPRRPGLPLPTQLPTPVNNLFRPAKAKAFVPEPAKAAAPSSSKVPAFAVLNSDRGPVLAPSE